MAIILIETFENYLIQNNWIKSINQNSYFKTINNIKKQINIISENKINFYLKHDFVCESDIFSVLSQKNKLIHYFIEN